MRLLFFFLYISFCILCNRCTLLAFLNDTLMMAAAATETCRRIVWDKVYFISLHLLVSYWSVNIPQCTNTKHINLFGLFRRNKMENSPRYSLTEATGSNREVVMDGFQRLIKWSKNYLSQNCVETEKGPLSQLCLLVYCVHYLKHTSCIRLTIKVSNVRAVLLWKSVKVHQKCDTLP